MYKKEVRKSDEKFLVHRSIHLHLLFSACNILYRSMIKTIFMRYYNNSKKEYQKYLITWCINFFV